MNNFMAQQQADDRKRKAEYYKKLQKENPEQFAELTRNKLFTMSSTEYKERQNEQERREKICS